MNSLSPTTTLVKPSSFTFIPTPGAIKDNWNSTAKPVWNWIKKHIGKEGTYKQEQAAKDLGLSTRTIQRRQRDFIRTGLLKVDSYNGQGRGAKVKNLWIEKAEDIQNQGSWARARMKEDKYLRECRDRKGRVTEQFGTTALDCLSSFEKTTLNEEETSFNNLTVDKRINHLKEQLKPNKPLKPGEQLWKRSFKAVRDYICNRIQDSDTSEQAKNISDIALRSLGKWLKDHSYNRALKKFLYFVQQHGKDYIAAVAWGFEKGIKVAYAAAASFINSKDLRVGWHNGRFYVNGGYWKQNINFFRRNKNSTTRVANPGEPPADFWNNTPAGVSKDTWQQRKQNYERKYCQDISPDSVDLAGPMELCQGRKEKIEHDLKSYSLQQLVDQWQGRKATSFIKQAVRYIKTELL